MLAIAFQMLVLPLLAFIGVIQFNIPPFYPLGAILGGFVFGLAMNWGGGCAAGIWYKLGAGSVSAFISVLALIVGYVMSESGAFKSVRLIIQSGPATGSTLGSVLNIPLWWIALPLALVLLFFLLKDWRQQAGQDSRWRQTGLAVGMIGVVAWITSCHAGRFFGMAVMPGSKDAFDVLSNAKWSGLSWDFFFVLGIPVGGFVSALRKGEFKWSNIAGASIWTNVGGGLLLGISASLAGGCTVGHGLTGIPLLSIASIVFTVAAMLGAWAGVAMSRKSESTQKNCNSILHAS